MPDIRYSPCILEDLLTCSCRSIYDISDDRPTIGLIGEHDVGFSYGLGSERPCVSHGWVLPSPGGVGKAPRRSGMSSRQDPLHKAQDANFVVDRHTNSGTTEINMDRRMWLAKAAQGHCSRASAPLPAAVQSPSPGEPSLCPGLSPAASSPDSTRDSCTEHSPLTYDSFAPEQSSPEEVMMQSPYPRTSNHTGISSSLETSEDLCPSTETYANWPESSKHLVLAFLGVSDDECQILLHTGRERGISRCNDDTVKSSSVSGFDVNSFKKRLASPEPLEVKHDWLWQLQTYS